MTRNKSSIGKGLISILLLVFLGAFSACIPFSAGESVNRESISGLETEVSILSTQNVRQDEIISYLATQQLPLINRDSKPDPTFTPYQPIIGGIRIEDGACCVGGTAGETVDISVLVEARNIEGIAVTEMRILHGGISFTESHMENEAWEPYVPIKVFNIPVATNWKTYFVCVQFRDSENRQSKIICDDIAVEGHPATDTPSP